jgi:hypothetical protein
LLSTTGAPELTLKSSFKFGATQLGFLSTTIAGNTSLRVHEVRFPLNQAIILGGDYRLVLYLTVDGTWDGNVAFVLATGIVGISAPTAAPSVVPTGALSETVAPIISTVAPQQDAQGGLKSNPYVLYSTVCGAIVIFLLLVVFRAFRIGMHLRAASNEKAVDLSTFHGARGPTNQPTNRGTLLDELRTSEVLSDTDSRAEGMLVVPRNRSVLSSDVNGNADLWAWDSTGTNFCATLEKEHYGGKGANAMPECTRVIPMKRTTHLNCRTETEDTDSSGIFCKRPVRQISSAIWIDQAFPEAQ